jgi:hypothetical protein
MINPRHSKIGKKEVKKERLKQDEKNKQNGIFLWRLPSILSIAL